MPGRLIERQVGRPGASHVLGTSSFTIGRGQDNDLVVDSRFVSQRHVEITWNGNEHVLHDIGKNGTFLNGRKLSEAHALRSGDVIVLPGQPGLTLVFEAVERTATWVPEQGMPADVRVDTTTAEVWVRGERIHVRPKEYAALVMLSERAGALVTKEELAGSVWPEHGGVVTDDDIAQLITSLRRKVEPEPERPRYLITVRGLGYRLLSQPSL